MNKTTFVDSSSVLKIAKNLYPHAKNLVCIDHGYDNIVVLVDEDYAIRFPRNKGAYLRSLYERQILKDLKGVTMITLPEIISTSDNPAYVVTSFVHGKHVHDSDINRFSLELQDEFATKIADFAYTMHTHLSVEKALRIRQELELDELEEEPWNIYFKKQVQHGTFLNTVQEELAKDTYTKWSDLESSNKLVVLHDDLHSQNMLFNEENHLVGVLDFGDTNIGTPEQEFRQLYWINERVLRKAVEHYEQLSGEKLDLEAAKIWSIMHEMASYSYHLAKKDTSHTSFKRAEVHLGSWLPHGEW